MFLTLNVVAALLLGGVLLAVALTGTAGADTSAAATPAAPATAVPTVPATAATRVPTTPVTPLPPGCTRLLSQRDFARAARSLYRGERRPTVKTLRHLAHIAHCQHSRRATRRDKALQRHLDVAQRASMCSDTNPTACIRDAANRYHVSYALMLNRAVCESTLNHLASNGTHFGLYQFLPSTWRGETSYGSHSYWSAKWNALGAAEMQSKGMGDQWQCRG